MFNVFKSDKPGPANDEASLPLQVAFRVACSWRIQFGMKPLTDRLEHISWSHYPAYIQINPIIGKR